MGERTVVEEPRLPVRSTSLWAERGFLLVSLPALALALIGIALLSVSGNILLPFQRIVTLEGKMASKREFFEDKEVQRLLLKHHYKIHITGTGSREVAIRDISKYDFVFPSGQPAGDLITDERAAAGQYNKVHRPFVSPIVLPTYRAYAETLEAAGLAARQTGSGDKPLYYTLNTKKFLDEINNKRRWSDIGVRQHGITNTNRILVQSPDVCDSNSAGTYLALVAFTWRGNGDDVPSNDKAADERARAVKPLLEQGMPASDVFRTYLSPEGKGIAPVVVAYEHQFFTYQAQYKAEKQKLDSDRVLLYPDSQFVTQPQFIALNKESDKLGELITMDPELRQRALELGFRILDPTGQVEGDRLTEFLQQREIPVPSIQKADTHTSMPKLRYLERMISIVGECPPADLSAGGSG
ncbi:hypothetical protein [Streptomyces sp. NPDC020681]|uniref:hypothetical protein n=1 Tax=Streptomyces sp. NPDC020681 TaxID=3365083 RepID=UPI003787ED29